MLKAFFKKHTLKFITPGGTSRGILKDKDSWYLHVFSSENPNVIGIGECSLLRGLSIDDRPDYEHKLQEVCEQIHAYSNNYHQLLSEWPSIRFGLETALLDLHNGGEKIIFPSAFITGNRNISINGLIWMGDVKYMKNQLSQKLADGFNCIKIKVGAIDFEQEINLIKEIRTEYPPSKIEIRVDANGAFTMGNAMDRLHCLFELGIHSIEQPIKAGQWDNMAALCKESPLPIALDEELIGINNINDKEELLRVINPPYVILKPSLLGGFVASEEWIQLAEQYNIKWWATSALEGNIGLNAIAQWTAIQNNSLPQGLGTGKVFSNNIDSPLQVNNGQLLYNTTKTWGIIL